MTSRGRLFVAISTLAAATAGCDFPQRPPVGPATSPHPAPALGPLVDTDSGAATDPAAVPEPWESWRLYVRRGKPVGYGQLTFEPSPSQPNGFDCRLEERMAIRRGQATLIQRLDQTSSLDGSGDFRRMEAEQWLGPLRTSMRAELSGEQLTLVTSRGRDSNQQQLSWGDRHGGPALVERSLRSRPMKPGEARRLRLLQPLQGRVVTAQLTCVGEASVPDIEGNPMRLLEISRLDSVDGEVVGESVLWADRKGVIRRMASPEAGLLVYASSRDEVRERVAFAADAHAVASVDVEGALSAPAQARRVAFEVRPSEAAARADREIQLQAAPGQYVRRKEKGVWQVLVSRRDETVAKGFTSYKREFDNADLMPSYWVDFRAAAVVEFDPGSASSLGWTDKEIADDLVKYVSRSVRERVPGGLSRASQVVKRLAGDSLGHAVLLTALLRGEGVPARVAVGLRYRAPDAAVMDFHAWTVAYHDGRWRSLDATFGKRPPADRITLAILNLREDPNSDPHRQLTEMLRTLGDLQIRLVGSESGQAEGESN